MTAARRVGLAFCSLLLSILLLALMFLIPELTLYGWKYAVSGLEILPVYLLFAFPGLLIALPFVLFFKDAEGWRMWAILAIGSAIGPAFLETWSMLKSHGHFSWEADGFAILMSVRIGVPTTVAYVLLLRLFDRLRWRAESERDA